MDGVDHSPEVFERRVELDMMGWGQYQSSTPANCFDALDHLTGDIGWGTEGQRVLLIDCATEAELVAVLSLELSRVHAGRLDGIEHIQADLDQVQG